MIYWIVNIAIIAIAAGLYYKQYNHGLSVWIFGSALIMKLIAGMMVGWIFYNYYQSGDTILFFEESKKIASLPWSEYVETLRAPSTYLTSNRPRVLFFTKLLSFFTLITGGSYWLASLYLSLISFLASWFLVTTLIRITPANKNPVIFCFFFIPTIVFWSSGILKDSITFGALLYLVAISIKVYYSKKVPLLEWLIACVALFVLFRVKHYILISFIVFAGLVVFTKLIKETNLVRRITAFSIGILAIVATQFVHPYLRFDRLALTVYETNQAILEKSDPINRLNLEIEKPALESIAKHIPMAVQIGLFRPSVFDHSTIWGWLHRLENLLLLFLFALSIILYFKIKPKIEVPLILSAVVTIILLATMLALSTPNFGTLVRYKNAFLPFFFLLCSILPYQYFTSKSTY